MIHRSSVLAFSLASLVAFAAGCSGGNSGEDTATSGSESALTALTPDEVVGSIAYGQTSSPIAYTDTPRYRALRFTGNSGDAIDVLVHATNGGHARAWILASDYSNIAYGNSDGSSADAHMTLTLPSTGTFYVAFRDFFQENATFTVALQGPPPPPPPPPPPTCDPEVTNCPGGPGNIVTGNDRAFSLHQGSSYVVETWGKGLWEGYMTFTLSVDHDPGDNIVTMTDANKATYVSASSGAAVKFVRIPLPVTMTATSDGDGSTAHVTGITYEITKINPIPASSMTGTFAGVTPATVSVIGSDIPGVKLQVSANATFFQNFTNGNACDRLQINDKFLDPTTPSGTFSFTAPLTITSTATCVSAKLTTPQNSSADFSIGLSSITVGNPN